MNRREFMGLAGVGISCGLYLPEFASLVGCGLPQPGSEKAYGSGHFGEWVTDQFGLPAYRYTCNQLTDSRAQSMVHREWRGPADHSHQVGNDRLVAVVSNYGYVQVRQDEGGPKFLNDYAPERGLYGGGIGYLTDGKTVLSTYYPGGGDWFERIWGEGLECTPKLRHGK